LRYSRPGPSIIAEFSAYSREYRPPEVRPCLSSVVVARIYKICNEVSTCKIIVAVLIVSFSPLDPGGYLPTPPRVTPPFKRPQIHMTRNLRREKKLCRPCISAHRSCTTPIGFVSFPIRAVDTRERHGSVAGTDGQTCTATFGWYIPCRGSDKYY
jgi:hypothetical protein